MEIEEIKEIWNEFETECHEKGELGNQGWFDMCKLLRKHCEEKGYYSEDEEYPGEGDVITNPLHLACIDGVQIGYKLAMEREKKFGK
jgi:hypothetical protein